VACCLFAWASSRAHVLAAGFDSAQDLRETNSMLSKDVSRLTDKVSDLTSRLADAKDQLERHQDKLRCKKTEVKCLARMDDSSKDRIEALERQVDDLQSKLLDAQKEYLRKVKADEAYRDKQRAK
jgi:predicted RNase H-like nuclease (RuvC/YqgF family)